MTLGNLLLKSSPQNCSNTVMGRSTMMQRLIATLFVAVAFLLTGGQEIIAQCSISPTGGASVSQDFTTSNVGSCVDLSEQNLGAVGITAGVQSSPPDSCFIYFRNPDVAGTGLDTLVRTDSVIVCCNVAAPESDVDGNLILPPGTYSLFSDDDGVFDDSTAQDSVIYTINLIDNGSPSIDSCEMDTVIYANANCQSSHTITAPRVVDNCCIDSLVFEFSDGTTSEIVFGGCVDSLDFGDAIVNTLFDGSSDSCSAVTQVTWKVYDASGNVDSCSYNVTVVDTLNPTWADCATQIASYPSTPFSTLCINGNDTVIVMAEDTCETSAFNDWDNWKPVAEDNCGLDTVIQVSDDSTYTFDSVLVNGDCIVYQRTQRFVAFDNCDSMTTDTFTLIFQIKDTEAPEFASDIVTDTTLYTNDFDSTLCGVDVCASSGPYGSVIGVFAEDCITLGDSSYSWSITADDPDNMAALDSTDGVGPDPCQFFPVGDYTITYTATDLCGNTSATGIALSIVDNSAPTIADCPANDTINTLLNNCFQVYSWLPPTAMDNCELQDSSVMVMDQDGNQIPYWIAGGQYGDTTTGFQGYYGPNNWTEVDDPACGNGSVDASGAPASIVITGSDNGVGQGGCVPNSGPPTPFLHTYTDYCITIPHDGTIQFDWDFQTIDGPLYERFGYKINGQFYLLSDTTGGLNQSGSESIPVDAGDDFCFSVDATDNIFGPQATTTFNFIAPIPGDTLQYFAALPQGTNTIQHKYYDATGNADTCEFTVHVRDNQAPEIIACAANSFFGSICDSTQIPDYRGQIAYNENCNCDTIYQDPAPGSYLIDVMNAQGDTLPEDGDQFDVTFVVEDCEGNADTCTSTMTLQDNDAPIPTQVPLDATVDMDDILAAGCGEVTIPVPTAIDCNGCIIYGTTSAGSNVTYNPGVPNPNGCDSALVHPSYTFYVDPGDSVANFAITWFYDDGNGNLSTQTQQITVMEDFKPPVVMCPENVTIGTGEDMDYDCDVVPNDAGYDISIDYVAPELPYPPGGTSPGEYTDNCDPDPTVEYSISGATAVAKKVGDDAGTETFNQGINTVTYYVTDNRGNSASCSFTVEVPDDQLPMVTCPLSDVTLNTGDMGDATAGDCGYTVADSIYDPSNIFDNCAMDTVYYTVSSTTGGVNVIPSTGTTLEGTTFDLSASPMSMGSATIQWFVIDSSGNSSQCTTVFQVNDDEDPVVTCPANVTVGIGEDGDSTDCVYTVQGTEFDPDTSDNCMVISMTVDVPGDVSVSQQMGSFETLAGAEFPLGNFQVTWTVSDKKGNTSSCAFVVTVVDDVDPVFTYCPADDDPRFTDDTITLPNITGECFTSLLWARPDICDIEDCPEGPCNADVTITEMISDPTVQAQVDANFPYDDGNVNDTAYAQFPVGVTEVKYTATDAYGNSATCAFYVNVIDTMPPNIVTCVDDQVHPSNCPEAKIPKYTPMGVYSDNCENNNETLTVEQDPAPGTTLGDIFNTSDTIADGSTFDVTITVTDSQGNTTTCEFTVEVDEGDNGEPPVPTIAGSMLPKDSTDCGSLIVNAPTADDCGETFYGIPNQGQYIDDSTYLFTTGTYIVIWTYIDDENNTSAQSQLIIVEDDTVPPTIACQDVTVVLDGNGEGSITSDDVLASASDNCTAEEDLTVSLSDSTFDCNDVSSGSTPWVNEFHYDNTGTDEGEFIEIAGPAGLDLSGYELVLYNGANDEVYDTRALSGVFSDEDTGFGFIDFQYPTNGIQNGSPDGLALVDPDGVVLEFWSYEGSFTAADGPAAGMTSTDVGVSEPGPGDEYSIQLLGNGAHPSDFVWAVMPESPGDVNGWQSFTAGPGAGPLSVIVTVTDEFGNSSTCTAEVSVQDNTPPTAECQDITLVLDSNGEASIDDEDIDDGSTDNCSVASYEASQTEFDCSDVGDVTVTLTVTDPSGNTSTCTSIVTVEDNEDPIAQCTDITIALDSEGEATIGDDAVDDGSTDNCGIGSYDLTQTEFNCSDVGVNDVTLTVTDVNGNTATCTATVTVEDNIAPLVDCSEDIASCIAQQTVSSSSSDACGIASITWEATGATDTSGTGEIVSLKFNVGVTTVTWTVTDVNGNSTTCSTEVDITDSEAPTAICIDDINTSIGSNGTVTIPAEVFDGGSYDTGCDIPGEESISFQIEVNGEGPFDEYTFDCTHMGQNDVMLIVTDAACNTSLCWTTITIQDHVDPVAVCISDTFELVVDNGPVTLDPTSVDDGSSDNNTCDPISLSVDPSEFDESDVGYNTVVLTVTDASGNTATCEAVVEVVVPPTTLSGNISEEDADPVADVTVNVTGDFNGSTTTDGSGNYSLGIPTGSDITVTPEKDIDHTEGVSTLDLIMIQLHILTSDTLDSPYKLIAADASNNGLISTFDLVQLQSLLVGNISELPSNTSWRFVDEDYTFPDPTDPWSEVFPEWLTYTMNADVSDADFVGIKIGDVIENGDLQDGGSVEGRATILFETRDEAVRSGTTVAVDIRSNDFDALLGYQSTMEFDDDKLEFEEVKLASTLPGLTENNFGTHRTDQGQLIFNWYTAEGQTVNDGELLFTVVFKAVDDIEALSEVIGLSDAVLTSEAYTKQEIMNLGLNFRKVEVAEDVFELYQNVPNPFEGETTIGFVLPEATEASIEIFDASGRLIKEIEGEYKKGYNEENVRLEKVMNGVLYYKLSTDNHSAVKQMIIAE